MNGATDRSSNGKMMGEKRKMGKYEIKKALEEAGKAKISCLIKYESGLGGNEGSYTYTSEYWKEGGTGFVEKSVLPR